MLTTAEDDRTLTQQSPVCPSPSNFITDHPLPTSGRSSSVQYSLSSQVQDAIRSYAFGSPFASPVVHPDPTDLHFDPLVFHTPRVASSVLFSRGGQQAPRRATVSLASPHLNRTRYQPDATVSSHLEYPTHNINPPATLNAAQNLLTAWASGENSTLDSTILEDQQVPAFQRNSQWNSEPLSHFIFDNNNNYVQSAIDSSNHESTLASFLDDSHRQDFQALIDNRSEPVPSDTSRVSHSPPDVDPIFQSVPFQQHLRTSPQPPFSDSISPGSNPLSLPGLSSESPVGLETQASEPYISQHRLQGSQSTLDSFFHSSTEAKGDESSMPRQSPSVPSRPSPSSIGCDLTADENIHGHPLDLPPLAFTEASSQLTSLDTTSTDPWRSVENTEQFFFQRPSNASGVQRGFSYTYGSNPASNLGPVQSTNNPDQFMWDEKFLRSLESVIPLQSVGELRRESDPFPAAPVPQRPWEHHHRYSIANMPCGLSSSNPFGSLGPASASVPEILNSIDSAPSTSTRKFSSLSTHASEPTSAGPYTASTSVSEDSRLNLWSEPPSQSLYTVQQDSLNGREDLLNVHDLNGYRLNQSVPSYSRSIELNGCQGYKDIASARSIEASKLSGAFLEEPDQISGQLGYVNERLDPISATRDQRLGMASQPAYGFHAFAARCTPPLPQHRTVPFQPSSELTLPQAHISEDGQFHVARPPTRLRRLTMLTQPLWTGQRPAMASRTNSRNYPISCGERTNVMDRGEQEKLADPAEIQRMDENDHNQMMEAGHSFPSQFSVPDPRSVQDFQHPHCKKRERTISSIGQLFPVKYGAYEEPPRFGGLGQGPSPYPPGLNGKMRPKEADFEAQSDESMIPWQQDLRCDEDLYTPIWCRGQNDKKEGFCDMCEGGAWFRLKNSAYWYHKQYYHGVSSTTGHYFYPPRETKHGLSSANRQQTLGLCHECDEWVGYSAVLANGKIGLEGEPSASKRRCNAKATKKKDAINSTDKQSGKEAENGAVDDGKHVDTSIDDEGFDQSMATDKAASRVPTLWYKHAHKCHRHQTCKGAKGRKKGKKTLRSQLKTLAGGEANEHDT